MRITIAEAANILDQIEQQQWKWMKLKRFIPEAHPSLEERYMALEKHHLEETGHMTEVIRGLCETVASLSKRLLSTPPQEESD